jgi:hypothetical protein
MAIIFPVASGMGGDDVLGQLAFFLEQLDKSVELLRAACPASERIALVGVDSLAEVLLYDHARQHFRASEELRWWRERAYPAGRRRAILDNFNRKVALAAKGVEGTMTFGYPEPILDEFDATTFRVAHRYRNAAYHRGHHNGALAGPLVALYAGAVGRALVCSLQRFGVMGGLSQERLARLESLGWRPAERGGVIGPHDAAGQIVTRITDECHVDRADLAARLAEDLADRSAAVENELASLRRDGLEDTDLDKMLRAAQLQAVHGADDELVRLQDEQASMLHALQASDEVADRDRERFQENEGAQSRRMTELDAQFDQEVELDTPAKIRKRGHRLTTTRTVATLLQRYQPLDEQLQVMEDAVEWMAIEWDRYVQMQTDIARGK